ncbi:efflux RND transporter permease subunit [Parendozoicomonas haliclonae]|uniref:Efflux pump membrane transporter BepE n=1 Tax=Parendozoicomonas haliclonae TaxID=1960125 RepID=A0A1X7AMA6_9GAMM|nr:efflux RND transporter permease subunit [Parendozoicomonas haliclonae]SMA49109.1 Efflux pump membrane transporter BepE [Parendozoicomonas haliclonae]
MNKDHGFTDLFIRRPVLACVISLMMVLLGLHAYTTLPIRQYPEMENGVVTVTTAYPGASADLVQGFITTPLQQVIASASGIDYMTSVSSESTSTITAFLRLGYDTDIALVEIMAQVNQVTNQLPKEAENPVIAKKSNDGSDLMYLGFYSDTMGAEEVTDYLSRVIQPQLQTVPGVAAAPILGGQEYAMRIWLDPVRMAAYQVTATEVRQAIEDSNVQSAAGQTKGALVLSNVTASTSLSTAEQFANIVIRSNTTDSGGETLVRLKDVADIKLGSATTDDYVAFNGEPATYIGIETTSIANPLEVAASINQMLPTMQKHLPAGLEVRIAYDSTTFIHASIDEVISTLVESALIVIAVVFLFLGSLRTVVIPVVTIPLSMIGVLFFLSVMGYSINLLTLLAMVLAIGLVVDDAIVVVENIQRHIEEGKSKIDAALIGAREIAVPVISMTITLASVYAPIGFMGGLTGGLFKEFALTLAGSVIVSGVIALTLSPMMCSRMLDSRNQETRYTRWLDNNFERLKKSYRNRLEKNLDSRPVTLLFAAAVLISLPFMFLACKQELAPEEDNGVLFVSSVAPMYANIDYTNDYSINLSALLRRIPENQHTFLINQSPTNSMAGLLLVPWGDRDRSLFTIQREVQQTILPEITGLKGYAVIMPSLPGSGGGLPVQFILQTTSDYTTLGETANKLVNKARESGLFLFIDSTLTFDKPETHLTIDRDKAGALGISVDTIGATLSTMLSGNYINWFSRDGRSYKVIPQAAQEFRFDKEWLSRYYLRTGSGDLVPLSTLVTITTGTLPNQLTQFQQLNSTTIQGSTMPGVSLGEALEWLQQEANAIAPSGFNYNYEGTSRQFMTEGNSLIYTFVLALFVIYLVLAAQFESFRDPLIVMMTVPMSICGALFSVMYGPLFEWLLGIDVSLNIYSQIGLVTLIGLISKHGILIVEFANAQQEQGKDLREAIVEASELRLRPVLMTTAAMVFGILPLLFASGAGAVSRFNIGLVITTGMSIGTLFTLFVIPVMYSVLAKRIKPEVSSSTEGDLSTNI